MNKIVLDLDGTLTLDDAGLDYPSKAINAEVVTRLREYKAEGYLICIYTARGMNSKQQSIGRINSEILPEIITWLKSNDIPFDELHIGKPWCGPEGFYVDDRTIRPSEFSSLTHQEILSMLASEGENDI